MKEQYGENIKLFSDTDSIWFEVKTNDLYDFSEYPKHIFYMMKQIKSGLES